MSKIMKKYGLVLLLLVTSLFLFKYEFWVKKSQFPKENGKEESAESKLIPSDYFYAQRAFPYNKIDKKAYKKAIAYRNRQTSAVAKKRQNDWTFAGPTNIGGRVTDIEMFEDNLNTIFVGAASGGIFKSTDKGENWTPIFDNAASLSIGDIAIGGDKTMYVGTGEPNAGGGSLAYDGFGVYKSTDEGTNWEWKGLEDVGSIGKVVVNPQNSNEVFVAAMGHLFENNAERGIYRTIDGGDNWEQVLFVSDSTGAIDLAIHPENPLIMYAAMWERIRRPTHRNYGGATSGIYKSEDGGRTWRELVNGLPTAAEQKGRIGLAISNSNPNIIMAIYANQTGSLEGIYKSTDTGDSWDEVGRVGSVSFMWWFGKIFIDPINPDNVFAPAFNLYRSRNGGNSFDEVSDNMHVDQHALYIHPLNTNFVVAGNDGGVYVSQNGGSSWTKKNTLPITQFYTCEIDFSEPNRLYGGTQDNGTNRTLSGNADDWENILWGDGFRALVDPIDNQYVYAESQNGAFFRSVDGGISFSFALAEIPNSDRSNWNSPVTFDPKQSSTLYFGTHRVYKSTNRAINWSPISPDLSNGDGGSNLTFGTLTTIDVSPINSSIIYAGTDDGNVWNTLDVGNSWTKLSENLPQRWVTDIATDPINEEIAYVIYSGYRFGENIGHIYKTLDNGNSWEDLSGNLPDVPLNAIIINPENTDHLFVASDIGVFETLDGGFTWALMTNQLPNVPVTDLDFHPPTQTLVAATYGRGMYQYVLPVSTSVTAIQKPSFSVHIFPNPVRSVLTIDIELQKRTELSAYLTDLAKRTVKTIVAKEMIQGHHQLTVTVDELAAGFYFCVIEGGLERRVLKVEVL